MTLLLRYIADRCLDFIPIRCCLLELGRRVAYKTNFNFQRLTRLLLKPFSYNLQETFYYPMTSTDMNKILLYFLMLGL